MKKKNKIVNAVKISKAAKTVMVNKAAKINKAIKDENIEVQAYKEEYVLVNYTDQPDGTNHAKEGLKENILAIPNKKWTMGIKIFRDAMKHDTKIFAIVYDKSVKGFIVSFESLGRPYIGKTAVFTGNGADDIWDMRVKGRSAYAADDKIVTKKEMLAQFPGFKLMGGGTTQRITKEMFDWLTARLLR